ncbi:type II secretion system protein [Geminisphaera colitermitum]|uniref:type II secretion system protein n=1 Tax=Geminisphaera colitermitum TaxID=1148786 RepID=UPI00019651AB|nr:type II secretion system protein [Geminisphaera colitermitum]
MQHPVLYSYRPRAVRGFTLIELLTVIAIIGVLAGILIPVVNRVRETARASVCVSTLRQYGVAFNMFVVDNKDRFPQGSSNNPKWLNVDGIGYYMSVIKRTEAVGRSASCPTLLSRCSAEYAANPEYHETRRGYRYNKNLNLGTGEKDKQNFEKSLHYSALPAPSRTLLLWEARSFGVNGDDISGKPGETGTSPKYRHHGRMNCLMVSGAIVTRRGNDNPDETVDDTAIPYAEGGINWKVPGEPFFFKP